MPQLGSSIGPRAARVRDRRLTRSSLAGAVAAVRAGRPVAIDGEQSIAVLALETGTLEMLELLDPKSSARLAISGMRAAALHLANDRHAADPAAAVAIERASWLDRSTAMAIVDPGRDLDRALTGPLRPVALESPAEISAAIDLMRSAGLLPAVWLLASDLADVRVSLSDIEREQRQPSVSVVARAKLPIDGLPASQIIVFRSSADGREHVALAIGASAGRPPLVRLHSECLTGDVFGSLKCDCGPQLRTAMRLIAGEGGGVLLYLRQEGRGIGLANKIRAYALQDRGLDTVEANARLGFVDDQRDYGHAAAMLQALGIDRVRLLTNNPQKVAGLNRAGIEVVERVSHEMPPNPHNADYLATKRDRSGHLLS